MTDDDDDGRSGAEPVRSARDAIGGGQRRPEGPDRSDALVEWPGLARGIGSRAGGPIAFIERVGDGFIEWAVFELDARGTPGARGPRCLVFWREHCLRRVWEYSANWRTLGDVELAALSMHR